jgi:prepilin signal peptidase PulO-like enzyme (type II secretory pathway)
LNVYGFVHFVATLVLAFGLIAVGQTLPRRELVILAVLVLWGVLNIGGIFDRRRWALPSELARLPVTAAALAFTLPDCLGYVPLGLMLGLAWSWYTLVQYRRFLDGSPPSRSRVIEGASAQGGGPNPGPTVDASTVPDTARAAGI